MKRINALFLLLLIPFAASSPNEAIGTVVNGTVIDGDTFNVSLYKHDSRISEDEIRVRLADINCPEISGPEACEAGRKASNYTKKWLEGKNVSLDLDDKTGEVLNFDKMRWIAVCYLNGENFNKQLVDAGHAEIDDRKTNEFDPMCWWHGYYPGNKETKVYHKPFPECTWACMIEQRNLAFFPSPGQSISEGYRPCEKCNPA